MSKSKILTAQARGQSMIPLINPYDKMFVSTSTNKYRIGDVIVFYRNGTLTSHRLIWRLKNEYIVKGDNIFYFDSPVKKSSIVGKVVKIKGKNGTYELESWKYSFFSFYYILYSLTLYIAPLVLKRNIYRLFRGRRYLIRFLKTCI